MTLADRINRIIAKTKELVSYAVSGVWNDSRNTIGVRLIKTINLAVGSFMDRGLQIKSMSLTYSTVLALVPAIAMLVAIGRGFGFQDTLQNELYVYFPSQAKAISTALQFVDSYLKEAASQGIFVGIGFIFLLWTIISLMSNIENAFNSIWDIRKDRTFIQKVTDYIAICLMVPILMVCSSGLSIFMSTTIADKIHIPFLTPMLDTMMETVPFLLCWIAFTVSFAVIPNTRVTFKYAAISGAICAVAFQFLQLLFVNGQIYVSKYNAIYGSFAFLPLLLIWLQLSWLILLSGCVLTYALQNVFTYDFLQNSDKITPNCRRGLQLAVMSVITSRYIETEKPLDSASISIHYQLPIRIIHRICSDLEKYGLAYEVKMEDNKTGYVPARDPEKLSVAQVLDTLDNSGEISSIPGFGTRFPEVVRTLKKLNEAIQEKGKEILIRDLTIKESAKVKNADNEA